jgi:hypothetical protein
MGIYCFVVLRPLNSIIASSIDRDDEQIAWQLNSLFSTSSNDRGPSITCQSLGQYVEVFLNYHLAGVLAGIS